jgi:hypothetical protein
LWPKHIKWISIGDILLCAFAYANIGCLKVNGVLLTYKLSCCSAYVSHWSLQSLYLPGVYLFHFVFLFAVLSWTWLPVHHSLSIIFRKIPVQNVFNYVCSCKVTVHFSGDALGKIMSDTWINTLCTRAKVVWFTRLEHRSSEMNIIDHCVGGSL